MMKTYEKIGRATMAYDKQFKVFMKKRLASRNLNVAETMVLMSLYEKDGQTQDELLINIHYDKSVMTRTIQALERAGRVRREQNPADARSFILMLTEKGRSDKDPIVEALREWCRMAFAGISDDRCTELLSIMQTVLTNVEGR